MMLQNAQSGLKLAITHPEPKESHLRRDALERERAAARRMLLGSRPGELHAETVWLTAVDRLIDQAATECGLPSADVEPKPLRDLLDRMRRLDDSGGSAPGRQA